MSFQNSVCRFCLRVDLKPPDDGSRPLSVCRYNSIKTTTSVAVSVEIVVSDFIFLRLQTFRVRYTCNSALHLQLYSLLGVGRGGDVRVAHAAVGERGRRGDGRRPARIIIIIIAMQAPSAKSRQILTHIIIIYNAHNAMRAHT